MANGDQFGDAVPLKQQDDFGPPQSIAGQPTMGPAKPRSLLQRAEDWWTSKPAYEGTLSSPGRSPQEKFRAIGQGVAVGSIPLLGGSLVAAPMATLLGLGGGVGGGLLGQKAGSILGTKVGAPELLGDVGG